MSWSPNPAVPGRKYGLTWTDVDPGLTQPIRKTGWVALLEKVAPLTGSGTLTVVVNPQGAVRDARLSGSGALTPSLLLRNFRAAGLNAAGVFVADVIQTRSCTADFTGRGELSLTVRDGLSAIVIGTYPAYLSSEGTLVCVITGGQTLGDGLSAIVQPGAGGLLSGTGTLTAAVTGIVGATAALSADGVLSASVTPSVTTTFTYTLPMLLTASTATMQLGGDGGLTATMARASVLPLQLTFILK